MIITLSSELYSFWGNRWGLEGFTARHASKISIAALAIPVIWDTFRFLQKNHQKIPLLARRVTHILADNFLPREQETKQQAALRIGKNLAICTAVVAAVAITTYLFVHLGMFGLLQSKALVLISKIEVIAKALEIPRIVNAFYAVTGMIHLMQAVRAYRQKDRVQMIKHLFAAAIAIAFPLHMISSRHIGPPRFHHMSYGLLALIPDAPALNFFGGAMVIDSLLYWIKPLRHDFDFSNIFVDKLGLFLAQLAVLTVFEWVGRKIESINIQELNYISQGSTDDVET